MTLLRSRSAWSCVAAIGLSAGCGADGMTAPAPSTESGRGGSAALEATEGGSSNLAGEDGVADGEPLATDSGDVSAEMDSMPASCSADLDQVLAAECAACTADHCTDQAAACDGSCGGLIACVIEQCEGASGDLDCIVSQCASCIASANQANALAACAQANCSEACPLFQPSDPPAPEPDGCRADLPNALGEACTLCAQAQCAPSLAACDTGCESLVTCAVDECGGSDVVCIANSCGSCLGSANLATDVGNCLATECADVCPPTGGDPISNPPVTEPGSDGGVDDPTPGGEGGSSNGDGTGGGALPGGGTGDTGVTNGATSGDDSNGDGAAPCPADDVEDRPRDPHRHGLRLFHRWVRHLFRHFR